jgi:hypothetical protein
MATKMIGSLRQGLSELYGLLSFRIFLVLVAIEWIYSAAGDFWIGFTHGVYRTVGW